MMKTIHTNYIKNQKLRFRKIFNIICTFVTMITVSLISANLFADNPEMKPEQPNIPPINTLTINTSNCKSFFKKSIQPQLVTGAVLLYNNSSVEEFSFEVDVSNSNKGNLIELEKEYRNEDGEILKAYHVFLYTVVGSDWVHKSDSKQIDTKDTISGAYSKISKNSLFNYNYYDNATVSVKNQDEYYTPFVTSMFNGDVSYSSFSTFNYGISGSFGLGVKVKETIEAKIEFVGEKQNGTSISATKTWMNPNMYTRVRLLQTKRSYTISYDYLTQVYSGMPGYPPVVVKNEGAKNQPFISDFSPTITPGDDEDVKGE